MAGDVMIELCDLSRSFGTTRAVRNVSFAVRAGQVFGYIGPNGAGKTTSMRILATLDVPTSGDALIDGFSVIDDADRVRRRLGFMPDSFGTYANVDVREYLDFFARAYGLRGATRAAAIERVERFTQLDQLATKPITGLSKGMKQRLCLGRALIHDPPVLVLDEPAAGLDPRARIELREMIRALAREGKTILVSSHILSELAEMCDTVGIIEQGTLIAVGSIAEIEQGHQFERTVEIEVLNDGARLLAELTARPALRELRMNGSTITFSHPDDRDAEARLLRELVEAGHTIAAFGSRQRSLEEVFLRVTQGKIQ